MKFLVAFLIALLTTCIGAEAASPTIAVLTDGFGTGVGSPARANTPTGSSTGAYGPPNSTWGLGDGWIDYKGSVGTSQNTGWNIASTYATSTYVGPNFAFQDSWYTPTPNEGISATFLNATNTNTPAYGVEVRGVPNSDGYVCFYSNSSFNITRAGSGNLTPNALTGGNVTASVSITNGHTITVKETVTGDGSTTSTPVCTLTDNTTSTLLSTISGTDTTAEEQSGGRVGIYTNLSSGSTQVSNATIYSDTALPGSTVYIGFAPADSITYGLSTTLQNVPDVIARILNSRQSSIHYVPVNMGFSGSTTASWSVGNADNYLSAAEQNFNALGVKTIFTTLGGNDALQSVTPATWLSNYQAAINHILANTSVTKIIFNQMSYFDWVRYQSVFGAGSAASLPLLRSYSYNSLTGVTIGDTAANTTFQFVDYFGLTDGGHPADQAVPLLASLWANFYQPGVPIGTKYPVGVPLRNAVSGTVTITVPWSLAAAGIPGATGTAQSGNVSIQVPAASAAEIANLIDRMLSDGRATQL